ncbi:hypothetical protein OPV22_019026 [Ensete ventricosum]|uniref:Cytochrome P450 n=1 Tax=Ensete ventricosum TaxID=4639 RepID=A0AAV8QWX7_ENSVE|nr:hypothetical protein OPV22_019026 [Ensete ventricosum]
MVQTSARFFGASTSSGERCFVQVNVRSKLTETTFDMIVEIITGSRWCVRMGKRFVPMAEEAFRLSSTPNPVDFMPFLRWVGVNGLQKRMQRLEKEIDGLLEEIVDEIRRKESEENPQVYTDNITKETLEVRRKNITYKIK